MSGSDFLRVVGDRYGDFRLINSSRVEELDCFFREIVHEKSGAKIIHIENEDPENLFCLSFQTLPNSSNGAPHILEHTVLCGSKNFPVKDPFFSMTRRSLNTFMNAFTGSDFTCYPASSQIEKDFYNLLDVYLDAVFQAKLQRASFLQEGWRLEFEKMNDPSTPLKFKGIVYNEMKGSLASADARMWQALLSSLFPDLPYAHNSGGDPKEIPNLSYEELLEFYKTYYHPSRCLFFFYGNLSLKKHLDFIEERALKNVLPLPSLPPLPKQPRFTAPVTKTLSYAVPEDENNKKRAILAFGFLTCSLKEQEEVLALSILDSILMDTDASPLKLALLDSGLCTQTDAFMDAEMSEVPYLIICKGCDEDGVEALEALLFKELELLSQKPLPQKWVDAAIHQLELSRMEILGDSGPFGLTLFFRSGLSQQHGCDPEKSLQLLALFEGLLAKVQDPLYLPSLIKRYFLNNNHRTKVILMPDPHLGEKESAEEKLTLEKIRSSLSKQEEKALIKTAKELEKIQQEIEHQDLSCLPKVTLDDVPLLVRDFPLKQEKKESWSVFHHECFTNHLVYADMVFDLPSVEAKEIPYLQLLLTLIPELGAGHRDYKENLEYIHTHTGGIGISCSLHTQVKDSFPARPAISLRGKALERKIDQLFPLMQEMLTAPDLKDKKRIEERIRHLHTSLQNRLSKNSLRYASQIALSGYAIGSYFVNEASGLPFYHFINDLTKNLGTKLDQVMAILQDLYTRLFSFHNPHLVLSCSQEAKEKILTTIVPNLHLPKRAFTPWVASYSLSLPASQGRIIPTQVAYNVKAYHTASYIHPHSPALLIATYLLDNKVLHNKIREIGGAYGSGVNYSAASGCFYFHSYRDPHIKSTFAAFDEAIDVLANGKFNEQDLEEAKLGVIQHFDAPMPPSGRAILSYGFSREGKEKELRQEYRNKILQIEKTQMQQVIEQELVNKMEKAIKVSFASKELLEKEGKNLEIYPI